MKSKKPSKSSSKAETTELVELVLINDDHHTFDFVMDRLIVHCDHTAEQAEQCAMITHYQGECGVMIGEKAEIKVAFEALKKEGLEVSTRTVENHPAT